ncbi:MAG: substrate-binding domain-containing protein [Phycisphaerales bacterium]|nr:substrate-binding domain-containing protein [Phycisphaerales bacterium]MCB9857096.1 substrate-binding domain-containing protein [Phycisphaerales bacterium]MCB9861777.1 substrate-binding domain-containing protein [Phycisphaerales bacterium]
MSNKKHISRRQSHRDRRVRVRPLWLLALAVCAATAACDARDSSRSTAPRVTTRIAVVGTSDDDPAWDVIRVVAGKIVAESPNMSVSFHAPKDGTPAGQQAVVAELQSAKVSAVCVMPNDPESLRDGVRDLIQSGKPVVLLGFDIPGSLRSIYVGPNELEVGQAAATACVRLLPDDRRTVMLLHAGLDSPTYGARYTGFKSQQRLEPNSELFKEFDCGGNGVKGQQIIRRQSRLYPRVGGWVLLDDWPLRRLNDSESLVPLGCSLIVCRDDPKYFAAVRRGDIDALVTYDLYRAVSEAVRASIRLAQHRNDIPVDRIVMPVEVVTTEDIDWHEERWRLWRMGIAGNAPERE